MKRLTRIFKVILFSTCIVLNTAEICFGQQSSFWFEHLQLPDGDQANFIVDIAEDSLGFIWFGTWNGLYRYDGRSYTNYVHDPSDPSSLSANWVEMIYVDGEGTLWVGTFGGLNRFNPEQETFTSFRNDPENPTSLSQDSVTVIMEDRLGHLWVGTMGGLNRMDHETGKFTRYTYDPEDSTSLGNDQVRAIYEDKQGTIWIGTNSPFGSERDNPGPGGLNRFNPETGTFTRYLHDPDDLNTLVSNFVTSIIEDSRGTFWVGTWGNGLHTMDRESGTFTHHPYGPNASDKLSARFSEPQAEESEGGLRFIHEDNQGALWIGSYGIGLNRYDLETDKLISFESDPDDPTSLSSNNVWSMYQSKDGTQWVGMIPAGGFNKIHSTQRPFEHFTLPPMHPNNFTNIIDVDRSGILRVNAFGPNNTIVSFKYLENESSSYQASSSFPLSEIYITAIEQSEDGTLWVGSHEGNQTAQKGGLYQMSQEPNIIIPILIDSTNTGAQIGPIVDIYEDRTGILWLGTRWTGLFRLNRETGEVRQYKYDPEKPSNLSHANVTTIYEAPSQPGILWIGTEGGGLNRFDTQTDLFTPYQLNPENPNSLSGEYITSIYEEAPGRLLIGTRESGLIWFDVKNNTLTHFTTYNSGLSDNYVSCILGDKTGHIWIGTSQGLSRFDPESRSFYTFGPRHGVLAHPFTSSCDCDQKGNLIFGGINGFTVFNPDQIALFSSPPPPVVLTNFILAGQSVGPDPKGSIDAPIWKSEKIRLSHNENTFSFEFAALDYRDPQSNQYTYLLEGYDLDWRDAGTVNRANYTKIPPGEYVFRVRAANSEGVWNLEGDSISVTILPPWWQTWWAYLLYGIIFTVGILVVNRFQRRRLIAKEGERARERELDQEKEHTRELEKAFSDLEDSLKNLKSTQAQLIQSEKMASLGELTAGIAHEIQNPLNFVNNFSEVSSEMIEELDEEIEKGDKIEAKALSADIKENLNKITFHGKRADAIVKGMLEHSRTSSGEKVPTDINALADEYLKLSYHGMRAKDKSFNADFKLELDPDLPKVNVVASEIGRVILNLVNNAFYAVHEKTNSAIENYQSEVIVSTRKTENGVELSVKDNGPGIPDSIKEKIFQPFFTTKPTGSGTGLGLSLSYDIIKTHGGALRVESEQGEGTTFIISLPYKIYQ